MPISKSIKKLKIGEKKVVIVFDNDDKFEIAPDVYTDFHLFKGKVLTNKEITEIKKRNDLDKYLKYAFKITSERNYSKHQMKEKLLKKGASDSQIEDIIDILIKYQLIDDKELLKEVLEHSDYKHYGYNRIKEELYKKGISSIYIDKLVYDETREYSQAMMLLKDYEKKYSKYNYASMKGHIYQAYLRQGYSYDIASRCLEKLSPMDEKKEKALLKEDYSKLLKKYQDKLPKGELKEKIISSLLSKGYSYKYIEQIKEN